MPEQKTDKTRQEETVPFPEQQHVPGPSEYKRQNGQREYRPPELAGGQQIESCQDRHQQSLNEPGSAAVLRLEEFYDRKRAVQSQRDTGSGNHLIS